MICRGIGRDTPVSLEDESASQSAIKCFSSWIQHGVGVSLEESIYLTEPLLAAALNPNLTETSMDAVTTLVNHPEAHRYPNLLMSMLNQLLSLQEHLKILRYCIFFNFFESTTLTQDIFLNRKSLQTHRGIRKRSLHLRCICSLWRKSFTLAPGRCFRRWTQQGKCSPASSNYAGKHRDSRSLPVGRKLQPPGF